MATVSKKNPLPLAVPAWKGDEEHFSNSERYLAKRLQAVAADHRNVARITFVVASGIGLLSWLLVGVLADHWLVTGGLPAWARIVWLLAAIGGSAWAVSRWFLPLLRHRINLVYAARTIEQGHPELHNDLINTVLLQEHPEGVPETITRSLQKRTALGVAQQPADVLADRSQLVTLAYVLAALVAFACLYQLLSPKNLVVSGLRLAVPWSRILPPTRVRITDTEFAWKAVPTEGQAGDWRLHPLDVQAGQVSLQRGRQLIITATIRGRRRGEQPQVRVSPLNGDGSVDMAASWLVPMVRRGGGPAAEEAEDDDAVAGSETVARREVFEAVLPGSDRGMDRPAECSVIAGDGRTDTVRVVLVDVPSLLVRQLRYEFPEYTGRPPEMVQWQGDIRALEGTRVFLTAEASLPLADAWIDFGCDGKRDWNFTVRHPDRNVAYADFPLRLNEDRTGPWVDSYQLQMQLATGEADEVLTEEVRHRIEVIGDMPPEVRIVKPTQQVVRVPPDMPAAVQIAARDPDFALSRTGLEYRIFRGDQLIDEGLAWEPDAEHVGPVVATLLMVPADLGAAAGNRIAYRAVVEDNRHPKPNRGVSHRGDDIWPEFLVDADAKPQPVPPRPDKPEGDEDRQDDRRPNESRREDGQNGEGGEQAADNSENSQPAQGENAPAGQRNDSSRETESGQQEERARQSDSEQEQQPNDGQQAEAENAGEEGESGAGQGASSSAREPGDGQATDGAESSPSEGGQPGDGQQGAGDPAEDGTAAGDSRGVEPGNGESGASRTGEQNGGEGSEENPAGGHSEEPVASDGSEDGEAMERILQHRREGQQGEGQQGQQGEDQQGEQGEGQQGQQGEEGQQGQQGEGQQGEQGDGQQGRQGEGQQGQQGEGQQGQQGEGQQGEGQQGQQGEGQQGEGQQAQEGEGQQGQEGEGQQGQEGEGQQGQQGEEGQQGQQGEGQQGQQGEGQQGEGQQGQQGEGQQGEGQQGRQGEGQQGQQGEGQQGQQGQQGEEGQQGQEGEGQQGQQGEGQQGQQGEGQQGDNAGDTRGMAGQGSWSDGEGQREGGEVEATSSELEWGTADLDHARNATDLAIEHLRESLERGDEDLLEQLGWTQAEARAFLARWDAMQRLQQSDDPEERVEFDRAVRSLGLRPEGVRSQRRATGEQRDGEAEGRRSRPPSEYLERVRAYTQGLSTQ